MKCKACGFEFEEGIFCPECGTKFEVNEAISVQEEAIEENSNDSVISTDDNLGAIKEKEDVETQKLQSKNEAKTENEQIESLSNLEASEEPVQDAENLSNDNNDESILDNSEKNIGDGSIHNIISDENRHSVSENIIVNGAANEDNGDETSIEKQIESNVEDKIEYSYGVDSKTNTIPAKKDNQKTKKKFKFAYLTMILGIASIPLLCAFGIGFFVAVPVIIASIILLVKKTEDKVPAIVGMVCSAITVIICIIILATSMGSYIKEENLKSDIKNYINAGEYDLAYDLVLNSKLSESTKNNYYYDIFIGQGDYDKAANIWLSIYEKKSSKLDLTDEELNKVSSIYDNLSDTYKERYDAIIQAREDELIKKQEEEKAAAEQAAKEQAEKEAAEQAAKEQAAKEAAEQAAKEQAEKEAAEQAVKEQAAAEQLAKEQAEKEASEKAAQEEKNIVDNAKTLGVDLVMESDSKDYKDKYYKTEGTVEKVEEDAYLIRYLSTVNNHKQMYWAWINTSDASKRYVGENLFVVGKYYGFAKGSSAPTLNEYKVETSSKTFYSALSSKAKKVNKDVTFENLLRYGEYQEYVFVEGTVTNVFDTCINIKDFNGNYYLIFDLRVDQKVVLQGDYIYVYGQFEGIQKDGYVWPKIAWLVDGKEEDSVNTKSNNTNSSGFVGSWTCVETDRVFMTITGNENEGFSIEIIGGGGAFEYDEWYYGGQINDYGVIQAWGSWFTIYTANGDGVETGSEQHASAAEAYFYFDEFDENKLIWFDADNQTETVFKKNK